MASNRKRNNLLLIVSGILLAAAIMLAAAFFLRANHYRTHFFPGTVMSGVDVSELTAEEATE